MWRLESSVRDVRVPVAPGGTVTVRVTGRCASGRRSQTLAEGSYVAPERLAYMGAPGHLVSCSTSAETCASDAHFFAHVLNVEGRGLTIVHFSFWSSID
jgi:hypothetical protein